MILRWLVLMNLCLLSVKCAGKVNTACCSFPCQNNGECVEVGEDDYSCDCSQTNHYGKSCEYATFMQKIKNVFTPSPESLQYFLLNYKWLWNIINAIPSLHGYLLQKVYLIRGGAIDSPNAYSYQHTFVTAQAAINASYYGMLMPPVPLNCPTPLGVVGPKMLPDARRIVDLMFKRKKFKPDPTRSNVLIGFYAQWFTHMFVKTKFKEGPQYTWGGTEVDLTNVYGKNEVEERFLRTFSGGKLKTQIINGEAWPPLVKDAPVTMKYRANIPNEEQFALGHELYGMHAGLFMFATIWVREHNRVCDVLRREHPGWSDERLYQTARLILIGETLNISIENYVRQLSRYNLRMDFSPELLFGQNYQYHNRIAFEFNILYHWHQLMPDEFTVGNTTYPMKDFLFNLKIATEHGVKKMVKSFVTQSAGAMTSNNNPDVTLDVAHKTILYGRRFRVQSFNNYRRRFKMAPYKNFEDLTGDPETAKKLSDLYSGDIEAVETFVGLMAERHLDGALLGTTLVEAGGSFSVKGIMSSFLCSPKFWRPSTFGGQVGFDIVRHATVQKLFCQNMEGDCPRIEFTLPDGVDPK